MFERMARHSGESQELAPVSKKDSLNGTGRPLRVLYSFPHKLGADRICYTAWQQVNGLVAAGADVLVFPGVQHRPLAPTVTVRPTLALGKLRISYKLIGTMRACALHDHIVARRLERLSKEIDVIHAWPLGSLKTLETANRLGIPTVLERPNAHTAFAYQVVERECERLGVVLPPGYEHAYNAEALRREEAEYAATYRLLCPSDFVVQTFVERGIPQNKCSRHIYGFDEKRFYPSGVRPQNSGRGLTMLFVGFAAVRKGLHFALEAWLRSSAHHEGQFLIAGDIMPAYAEKLKDLLAHPSVKVLGHRTDIPDLMRTSEIVVLPSIEEGFGLVCVEAMGSGCIPLVSSACTDVCAHMENALVHQVGDISILAQHITMLDEDRSLLDRLRLGGLKTGPKVTWAAAGVRLLQVYKDAVRSFHTQHSASA